MIEKVIKIPAYTINLRLYPNKQQKDLIDRIILATGKAYNMAVYDMFINRINTIEKKDENGNLIHFPDLRTMASKKYLDKLRESVHDADLIPANALSGTSGIFLGDLAKSLESQVKTQTKKKSKRPIENSKPCYYSKKHTRNSYKYSEHLSKIFFDENNDNVIYFNLAKIGKIKARGMKGYLKFLRFDESGKLDFKKYVAINKRKQVFTTVKKDNCGDYFLQLCLTDLYKIVKLEEKRKKIGVDVGVSTLITLSNGTKYENPKIKNGSDGSVNRHRECLKKRLSRRQGYGNIKFRKELSDLKKEGIELLPSKRYLETKLKIAKLERKITRQRKHHMENMVLDIVRKYDFIGIETLSVTDMYVKKIKNKK